MADFQLQILHASDMESGIPALEDAVNFSAVVNGLRDTYDNTLILSSGDNYIPGPFFSASSDRALRDVLGREGVGRADIQILNEIGFQASAFGNHEFDLGTSTVADLIGSSNGYVGTQFPYLSSNLDFTTDSNLARFVVEDGQAPQPNSIASSVILTVGSEDTNDNGVLDDGEDTDGDGTLDLGERIGVVGATTPTLRSISSPGNVGVSPADPTDYAALAAEIQTSVDELTGTGINKVVLLAHMQQINIEQTLAGLLQDVDVIIAGGSNTLLANPDDPLRSGDTSAGTYPIELTSAIGQPTYVVNTDGNWQYVGRLVLDFDANGIITNISEDSGAYATDDLGVDTVYGTDVNPEEVADPEVVAITNALSEVINTKDGNIFGETEVFLNGTRNDVRTQETNLGNLTADANLFAAQQVDSTVLLSLKNGGGIRDNIGAIEAAPGSTDPNDFDRLPPPANPLAGKEEGDVSQLDIENSLRFNNALSLVTVTAEQLLEVLEHGVSATEPGTTPGQFPQVGGLAFSFDAALPAGERVQTVAIKDAEGNLIETVVENGEIVGDPTRTFRMVTLSFLAQGGDGYPFPEFGDTLNQVDLVDPGVRTGTATFADNGTEQDAFAEYINQLGTFESEDVDPSQDLRIQNLSAREDNVLEAPNILNGTTNSETLIGSSDRNDVINAGGGNDLVAGELGDDQIFGEDGDDVLRGDLNSREPGGTVGGDDLIYGGAGNDRIGGKAGNDSLYGDEGDDQIYGDAGDDLIRGGLGNDILVGDDFSGGTGSDTFVLAAGEGTDTIQDFKVGVDFLELVEGLSFGQLAIAQEESNTLIRFNDETLAILTGVNASDLSNATFTVV
ncbi:5'-nucleotidase C-terminal domain-containing protein [Microcoleus sp. FACHB-SPT15]|uniref:5'-nucleotidase C-terminal domain-containing protein n=1 Tax=Microcoleus sp. FACHB-SPT15 TaxID=2692830 RepID=UPI00177F06B6|nr:5'-nucleotidase C-terminal domain-containing protein [Microcoleus sp. FACHB-SPT15]MBD1809143.1 5'-nucleotidase C-terminal domain-containing protein [Microcoleus sp. FACHB-SPT15]